MTKKYDEFDELALEQESLCKFRVFIKDPIQYKLTDFLLLDENYKEPQWTFVAIKQ